MKKGAKSFTFYALMILVFGSLMYVVIREGESHQRVTEAVVQADAPRNLAEGFTVFLQLVSEHVHSSFGLLLLQIIVILITCRIVGVLFKKIGQPMVIGEILAGIILGPSVLGHFTPEFSQFLFPKESLSNINLFSQFGLMLFMYTIGMELDMGVVRKKLRETMMISYTCMLMSFFLGMLAAYLVYDRYADQHTPFLPFALFIGITMSITAFPVLARIIQEHRLTRTHLGTVALASAANGDVTAWCLLAIVVAVAQAGTMLSAVYNIVSAAVYILMMFTVVRPLLRMVGNLYHNKEVVSKPLVMLMFLLLLMSSYLTEILGLHALFGAFVTGLVMPENLRFRKIMTEKVEDVSLVLFLPLFFASTGLRTEIGLIDSPDMWLTCLLFIAFSTVGKFGGALLSARFENESWKNSFSLGALMNTHGLMELIALTIGYEMKILPPPIFVMLILMTLVTTFMTTPLLKFIHLCFRTGEKIKQQRMEQFKEGRFKVLLSFGRAGNGQIMLDVAHQMFSQGKDKLDLTALHLTVGSDINPLHTDNFERVSFGPILYEARKLNMQIHTRYEVADHASESIVRIVNDEPFDFLLVGAGISMSNLSSDMDARSIQKSFFGIFKKLKVQDLFSPGSLIHDKTKEFIERSHSSVGVFINRGFVQANHILILINSSDDLILLDYVRVLLRSTHGTVSLLNRTNFVSDPSDHIVRTLTDFTNETENAHILPEKNVMSESFSDHDFMLVSYTAWNIISEECKDALQDMPSTLIIHHREKV